MDAATLGTAILGAGLVSTTITQVSKRWIPSAWRSIFAAAVSALVGAIALWLTGGFDSTTWPAAIAAVIGTAQALYAVTFQIASGKTTTTADTGGTQASGQTNPENATTATQG